MFKYSCHAVSHFLTAHSAFLSCVTFLKGFISPFHYEDTPCPVPHCLVACVVCSFNTQRLTLFTIFLFFLSLGNFLLLQRLKKKNFPHHYTWKEKVIKQFETNWKQAGQIFLWVVGWFDLSCSRWCVKCRMDYSKTVTAIEKLAVRTYVQAER